MEKGLIFALLFALAGNLFAEEGVIELEKTVITAEKFETSIIDTPKTAYVVTSEEIEKTGASSVMDVLKSIPGVFVGDFTGSGKTGTIDLRGQGEPAKNNVLVLVDGVSTNSIDMSGTDYSTISIDRIERIEVISGSGGVLYGDKAVGGVINIITKQSSKEGASAIVKLETGSFGKKGFGIGAGYNTGAYDVKLDLSRDETDGYRDNSDFEADNISLSFGFAINNSNKIRVRYSSHSDEYGMPGSLTEEEMKENREQALYTGHDANWNPTRLENSDRAWTDEKNYGFTYSFTGDKLLIQNDFNNKSKEVETEMISWSQGKVKRENEFITNNFKVKYDFGMLDLITGLDYSIGNTEKVGEKIEKNQLGLFAQSRLNIIESIEVITGVRNEQTDLEYYTGKEKSFDQTLFELGGLYSLSDSASFFANFTQNYRTPVTDEYFEAGIPAWGTVDHYNEELEPQTSDNIEIGFKSYVSNNLFVQGSLYKNTTENEIYYDGSHNSNMDGETERKGIEVLSELYFGDFTIQLSGSKLDTKVIDGPNDGKEVPGVPETLGNIRLNYSLLDSANINFSYRHIGKMYPISNINNSADKLDSFGVADAKISYEINEVTVYGEMNNIFDEEYSEYVVNYGYGSGNTYYPSPERNFVLGVKYEY